MLEFTGRGLARWATEQPLNVFIYLFILFIWKSETKIFHVIVYSPNVCGTVWIQDSILVPARVPRAKALGSFFFFSFFKNLNRVLDEKQNSLGFNRPLIQDASVASHALPHCITVPAPRRWLFYKTMWKCFLGTCFVNDHTIHLQSVYSSKMWQCLEALAFNMSP